MDDELHLKEKQIGQRSCWRKPPDVWNDHSPLVKIVAHRYERAGLHTWNNNRVAALCRALNKTIWVLCAEAGVFTTKYDKEHDLCRIWINRACIHAAWESNHWPVWMTLHFDRFERYVKTQQMAPGASLLGVADGAAIPMLRKRKPYGRPESP